MKCAKHGCHNDSVDMHHLTYSFFPSTMQLCRSCHAQATIINRAKAYRNLGVIRIGNRIYARHYFMHKLTNEERTQNYIDFIETNKFDVVLPNDKAWF